MNSKCLNAQNSYLLRRYSLCCYLPAALLVVISGFTIK